MIPEYFYRMETILGVEKNGLDQYLLIAAIPRFSIGF